MDLFVEGDNFRDFFGFILSFTDFLFFHDWTVCKLHPILEAISLTLNPALLRA
jgi:hypothetical protein